MSKKNKYCPLGAGVFSGAKEMRCFNNCAWYMESTDECAVKALCTMLNRLRVGRGL